MTYILVEGIEDKIFINYILLNIQQKSKDLFTIEYNGSHGITDHKEEQIEKHLLKNTNILIINDADDCYQKRKKELENKIYKKIVPNATNKLIDKNATLPSINIFLYPNNNDDGIFEDLLLKCIPEGHKIPECFDKFVSCLSTIQTEYNINLPVTKTKIYSYVDLQKTPDYKQTEDGLYFYRNKSIWDFNNKAVKLLLDFLNTYVK